MNDDEMMIQTAPSIAHLTPDPVAGSSILVAIPTLNEQAHIESTIHDLMANRSEMADVLIVIADGGSTDRTRDIVRRLSETYANVTLTENPDRCQAAAVNKVVAEFANDAHEFLVRIDAHSQYPEGYVLGVAEHLLARGADGVATVMDSGGTGCFQRGAAWATDTKVGSGGSMHRGGATSGWVDHGHHAGFLIETFRKVGGYDPLFIANEDAELDHRIGLAGGRIWLEASLRLGYVMRPTLWKLAYQYWKYGRGRAQTVMKHKIMPRVRQMIPPAALLGNLLGMSFAGLSPWFLIIPGLYFMVIAGTVILLLKKHRSFCALWAGPALFAMHHSWGAGFIYQLCVGRKNEN